MPRAIFLFFSLSVSLLLSAQQAWSADGRADYDLDDDGLIEINDWADLDEVRNNLDGSSLYGSSEGCPADGCVGFELTTDLDFDTNGDGVLDARDTYWNEGKGWEPIGKAYFNTFSAKFNGNGHAVLNLMISRSAGHQGLFGDVVNASISEMALFGPLMAIRGREIVGGVAGSLTDSDVSAVFVSGAISGSGIGGDIGGIAGRAINSKISASFVSGSVIGNNGAAGLVGEVSNIEIVASMSTAFVRAEYSAGGLIAEIGTNPVFGSVEAVYWAVDASGQDSSEGAGIGASIEILQCPTGPNNTSCVGVEIYENWFEHKDAEGKVYWDFGNSNELPGLRLKGRIYRDGDGDGTPDELDALPTQYPASIDADGDGSIDRWTLGCDEDCRAESGLIFDDLPESLAASIDTDRDGLPDQWNVGCDMTCQLDSGLTLDVELNDSDNDGVSNIQDEDDNNDGIVDADINNNGFIEVSSWAELNAVRYSLKGVGQRLIAGGNLDVSGCPYVLTYGVWEARCKGYELVSDLNFDTNGDGVFDSEDEFWNDGQGWEPIGKLPVDSVFSSVFHGNGHVISNLVINRPDDRHQGLFGFIENATVKELGLSGPLLSIRGRWSVGGIAGVASKSQVIASYVSGSVTGELRVGGLIGETGSSEIIASYATGSVSGSKYVGGLVGNNFANIHASFSTAYVSGSESTGGLTQGWGTVRDSYWATNTSGQPSSGGGIGTTLVELQCPTGADNMTCANTTIYSGWSNYADDQGRSYWDFGVTTELPGLRLQGKLFRDGDGDGFVGEVDAFPEKFAASVDSDGDGSPDFWRIGCDADCRATSGLVLDQFPENAAVAVDTDGDGLPDSWSEGCDGACQTASGLTLDTDNDNDGVANSEDAFPVDVAASVDIDNDGLPDAWLDTCDSACQSESGLTLDASLNDTDNDGVVNDEDAFADNAAASVDTDGDGQPDEWLEGCDSACQSASGLTLDDDNDNDGAANEQDAFPLNAAASVDTDNDGLPDAWLETCNSACQSESGLTLDASLNDTDNDGVVNDEDAFVDNAAASVDTDGDGQPDSWNGNCDSACQSASGLTLDDDNDNDGVANEQDAFPVDAAASVDDDNDGMPDAWLNNCDSACQSASGLTLDASLNDTDNDGVTNDIDDLPNSAAASADTDGDGQPDEWLEGCDSACQSASGLTLDDDNDNDGVANEQDAFPVDAAASVDADNDGLPDAWLDACDSACQSESGLTLDASLNDTDNDGINNDVDDLPTNAAASVDSDGDGHPDEWLEGCDSACQFASGLTLDTSLNDTDNDGVTNSQDAFPLDAAASVDADNDGLPDAWLDTCDNACQSASSLILDTSLNDTDNDRVTNNVDDLPTNAAASVDTDGDGQPDEWLENCDSACQTESGLTLDDDNDNDGVANIQDAFPVDSAASVDTDGDGQPDSWSDDCDSTCQSASGLTLDHDNDNDGVANTQDAFPVDAAASEDADNDGLPDAWLESCDSACLGASKLTLDPSLGDTDNDGVTNAEDAYPTDPSRAEDEDAPEILKAPSAIGVAATGESTLVTLNVNEAQAIDNFDDELDYQVELNGEPLAINADQQVSLTSGALSLHWFAVDDAGNRSEPLSQTVNVFPQVRFVLEESITGEDRDALLAVELSGPSPAYPISILATWVESESTATTDDMVTEGESGVDPSELLVTIDSVDALENAAVRIPVVGDGLQEADEVLSIALVSAIAGSADVFAMPIDDSRSNHRMTVTDNNVAPTVQVTGSQSGENGTIFINDAGEITLTAAVEDVNGGDTHSYQWYTEELPVTPGDQASFSFDPVSMTLGEYSARVVVTDDGNPMLSSEEETFTFTLQEAAAPDDGGTDDGGSDSGDQGDGDTDNGGDDDSSDGISTGGQTPVNNGGSGGSGSSGGSVGLWLLSLLALGGLWRRRLAYWRVSYWRAAH